MILVNAMDCCPEACLTLKVVGAELGRIASAQQTMELQYGHLANERVRMREGAGGPALAAVERELGTLAADMRRGAESLSVNLRQNPGAAENLLKLQRELKCVFVFVRGVFVLYVVVCLCGMLHCALTARALRELLSEASEELDARGTFVSLEGAVAAAEAAKENFAQLVAKDGQVHRRGAACLTHRAAPR
jgi:hypothetical protein